MQCIEPTTRLIDTFRNKICGKASIEKIFVLERIVMLRKWHRAGIEPYIDHVRYALHRPAARTRERYIIYIRFVRIEGPVIERSAHGLPCCVRCITKFFKATDRVHFVA